MSCAGGLPGHLFTSLGAPQDVRLAMAASGKAMPLARHSMDEAAGLAAGLLKSFEREIADTQLVMVPQVGSRLQASKGCATQLQLVDSYSMTSVFVEVHTQPTTCKA